MTVSDLSPRLALIASLVPDGAAMADVGTDHAYLPAALLKTGRIARAVGTDIHSGPLQSAAVHSESCGVADKLGLVLCDGLENVSPDEADTVVIAGMGGETILGILGRAPWTRSGVRLILQPQSKISELRLGLTESGYVIDGEYLVRDAGRIYTVITARGGSSRALSAAELYFGELRLQHMPELLAELVSEHSAKLENICRLLEGSAKPGDAERLERYREVLTELKDTMERGGADV